MIAIIRATLITLSVLTFLAGIVFPPLHLVTLVLMMATGGLMLVTWLDGKAKVSPRYGGRREDSASRGGPRPRSTRSGERRDASVMQYG